MWATYCEAVDDEVEVNRVETLGDACVCADERRERGQLASDRLGDGVFHVAAEAFVASYLVGDRFWRES